MKMIMLSEKRNDAFKQLNISTMRGAYSKRRMSNGMERNSR
jgi:hypothetical protein